MNRKVRQYIEHEIRHYPSSKRELDDLYSEIIHSSPSGDGTGIRDSGTSDSTGSKAIRLTTNARLKRLEETVTAIETVLETVDEEKYRLIELKYWKKPQTLTDTGISEELCVNRATMYRWINGICYAIGKNLGLAE